MGKEKQKRNEKKQKENEENQIENEERQKDSDEQGTANIWERYRTGFVLCLSFLLPVLIYFIVLRRLGFYPGGTKTVLFMDLQGQFAEYLVSLRQSLNIDSTPFFSWSHSMGGDMLGLYAYSSGGFLALFSLLFPASEIFKGVMLIELVAVGLCGLSFGIFMEWGFHKKAGSSGNILEDGTQMLSSQKRAGQVIKRGQLATVAFSVCYALMSYNMVYSGCFFWLNGCIFLPLIFLGMEQIFKGAKGFLFYLMLTLAMLNNYYTAYMVSIFSFLYFIFRAVSLYQRNREEKTSNIRHLLTAFAKYAGTACLAVMTSFPVLFAVVKGLGTGKLAANTDWTDAKIYFEFPKIFPKFLSGHYDSITSENILPSVFCGTAVLIFCGVWLLQWQRKLPEDSSPQKGKGNSRKRGEHSQDRVGKLSKRDSVKPAPKLCFYIAEKLAGCLIILFMLVCMWRVDLDKVWHGFQQPHWFPWRYTFLLSFFMVFLAERAFDRIHWFKGEVGRTLVSVLLVIVCCVDMGRNAAVCIQGLGDQFGYMEVSQLDDFYGKTKPLVDQAKSGDDGLYRMDKDYEFSKNDSLLLGYNGMTHYSSTYNLNINTVTPKLGLAQSWYWNSGYGSTPLTDSIFGVRYRMAEKAMPAAYEEIGTSENVTLYKNPLALPFAFSANFGCLSLTELPGDVFQNQNMVLSSYTGESREYFVPEEFTAGETEEGTDFTFQARDNNPVYIYLQWTGGYNGDIYVNGQYVNQYFTTESTCAVYLGTFQEGENVSVGLRNCGATYGGVWIYSLDMEQAEQDLAKLQEGGMEVTSHGRGRLKGTIHVGKGQVIATSIPYDEGYTVTVDGKKTDFQSYMGAFLAVEVPEGDHEIVIRYMTPGFVPGLVVAMAGILGMAAYAGGFRKLSGVRKKRNQEALTSGEQGDKLM